MRAGPGAAHLGMFRKTRHWGFRSWILEVRSVPSHWRQHRGVQAAVRGGLAHPTHFGENGLPPLLPTVTVLQARGS